MRPASPGLRSSSHHASHARGGTQSGDSGSVSYTHLAVYKRQRYLISEVMELPEQAADQVYYQLLKMAGKSMLEQIGEIERELLEYKEYIEQWIHEIKTPITAMKLLCENHRMD